MVANNYIEVYTLLFAWEVYEGIWNVLAGSGLAFIPFIGAIISSISGGHKRGQSRVSLATLERSMASMLLVLIFCVIPYGGPFTTSLSGIKYSLDAPDCQMRAAPPANLSGTGSSVGTGSLYNSTFNDMSTTTVRRSILWSLSQKVASAITFATIKSMSCVNNYSFMLARIAQFKISDPAVRQRIIDFNEACYNKALAEYDQNPVALPALITEINNLDWLGSGFFLSQLGGFYDHPDTFMMDMEQYGFNRNIARDSDNSREFGANPSCKEVWLGEFFGASPAIGLRQIILDEIDDVDEAGNILTDWKGWGSNVVSVTGLTEQDKENLIIKMVLQADRFESPKKISMQDDFEEMPGLSFYDMFTGSMGREVLMTMLGSILGVFELIDKEHEKNMIKITGPIILAMLQMLVIFASPLIMLIDGYSVKSFLSLSLTYFALEFINALWAAGFWFEQRMLDIYMSGAGVTEIMTNTLHVHNATLSVLIMMPLLWLGMIGSVGATAVGAIAGMMGGGGGGGASKMAGKGVKAAASAAAKAAAAA